MTMSKAQPRPASRAEQARQTKAGILAASLRLFAQHGYSATSFQDIADEVGLTKAAVSYHFPSKIELLRGVCDPVHETMTAVVDDASRLRTRRQRIDAMARGFVEVMISQRAVMGFLASDPAMSGPLQTDRSMDSLLERAIHVLYGDTPTGDQRLAVYAVPALGDALSALPQFTDEELRPILLRAVKRLVPER
ncbi:TetR/AcrR family transcriptional regulator [Streptomyces sp. NBC_01317]|uniref:TetR/AcrR family transcriptional regulator n=1 Tax=Streptomyces sp. NBC_01317 TaxID=2903822 RepID=UPI002E0E46AB|nr:TetR/AcrR family transcriptional regulator [Streptomyces sp. NBC_01317]